jgi:ketosteroid isomerase-like protein
MTRPGASEIVRAAYAAFNNRDVDRGVALVADNVLWPNMPDGGFVRGRDGVRAHWREQFEAVDPHIEVLDIDADGDRHVRASVRQIVRSHEGQTLSDELVTHVYSVRDGLIERMELSD